MILRWGEQLGYLGSPRNHKDKETKVEGSEL